MATHSSILAWKISWTQQEPGGSQKVGLWPMGHKELDTTEHRAHTHTYIRRHMWGCPGGSDGKEPACNAGDPDSIPEFRNSPGEGNGYPLQYSGLENSTDRGAWQAIVHGVTKSQT